MTNTWYASDWDQAYRPSYAKIRRTVVRHIKVHLYIFLTITMQYLSGSGWFLLRIYEILWVWSQLPEKIQEYIYQPYVLT